jgi:hypothetical protein
MENGRKSKVKTLQRMLGVSAVVVMAVIGFQGVSGAQPYEGNVVASDGTTTVAAQVVTTGTSSTWTATACGFASGATVTFTINGTVEGTTPAGSDGCAILSGVTSDPSISINGGTPVSVPYGNSTVSVSGVGPTGATVTDTIIVPVVAPAASSAAPLAFTGADIAAMVVGGLALIALGFLVLTFSRRRKAVA